VVLDAIQHWVGRLTWRQETFAYADSFDAAANRYRGLEAGRRATIELNAQSVVVKPEEAAAQQDSDAAAAAAARPGGTGPGKPPAESPGSGAGTGAGGVGGLRVPPAEKKKYLRRFHGTAKIDATRLSRGADQIASAVVQHLSGLVGATVTATIEIEAEIP
jgi:hypothetical protein